MDDFKIEKGIPLPRRRAYVSKFVNLGRRLEVGDSWLVDSSTERNSCRAYLKRRGFQVACRKDGEAWRMWCLQKPNNLNG